MSAVFRTLRRAFIVIALVALAGLLAGYLTVRASLAPLSGDRRVAGLNAAVSIERDALGVVTLTAANREDLLFGEGFVHAQERFFQMDLTRRRAAGELAELFGARAVAADRDVRLHGFSLLADDIVAALPADRRAQLEAYSEGVNAGLAQLKARPPEYWLIGASPRPWQPADSVLVSFAMYLDLNDARAALDGHRGLLHDVLPPEVYAWLVADGSSWDAPLAGDAVALPPLPARRWYDKGSPDDGRPVEVAETLPGSNGWAVSGALTKNGAALLANDMHLGLRVPNIWFRVRLRQTGGDGQVTLDAVGVSLPGSPGLVTGSNGHVAWGFTNSYGDWSDRVTLRVDKKDPSYYRVPDGREQIRLRQEVIRVKDADDVRFDVPMTRFGPLLGTDTYGRPVALRWLAHERDATNLALGDMLDVTELDSALALANRCGIPPQNIVIAAADGRIGWTIAGRIPRRFGYDARLPRMSDEDAGWRGWLAPADYPRRVNPPGQRIWTANARVADLESYALIGRGDYPLGARARQIRDQLFASNEFSEADMLAIQLDDRGLFMRRWRALMLRVLTPDAIAASGERADLRATLVEEVPLRAAVDSAAYLAVRDFRGRVERDLLRRFVAPALNKEPDFDFMRLRQREGPLWQAVATRPAHLLPAGHSTWQEYLLTHVDGVIAALSEGAAGARRWGDVNVTRIHHPLAAALPDIFARRLNSATTSLPGDAWMPRVQSPTFGASMRLVVSPGHEQDGLFHMPAGQSGHPLSPFYLSEHDAWARGEPTPLLPGPTRHTLTLTPEAATP